jgi:uncharacterized protein DUF3159
MVKVALHLILDPADTGVVPPVQFQIPRLGHIARHAFPRVIEGTLFPLFLFLVFIRLTGVWGAMIAGMVWTYGLLMFRVVRKERVPGILVLGSMTLTARTALAFLSGSSFVYFLQPSLSTALIAGSFLLSVPLGRPLAERLARDFVPMPEDVMANRHVRRFFLQISLLWGFMQLLNAAVTVWLLTSQSLTTFLVAKTAISWTITLSAISFSVVWFHRSMARNGIVVAARVPAPSQ